MLYFALAFLAVAVVAGIFGFSGIAVASAGIAQMLFFIFLALCIGTFILRAIRK